MTDTQTPLTADAICRLPAGREIDALIHHLVMDKPEIGCIHMTVRVRSDSNLVRCTKCGAEFGSTGLFYEMERWPHYSTDIAAAMSVLCQARGPGGWFQIVGEGDLYHCRLSRASRHELDGSQSLGSGETISLAICRAALVKQSEAP